MKKNVFNYYKRFHTIGQLICTTILRLKSTINIIAFVKIFYNGSLVLNLTPEIYVKKHFVINDYTLKWTLKFWLIIVAPQPALHTSKWWSITLLIPIELFKHNSSRWDNRCGNIDGFTKKKYLYFRTFVKVEIGLMILIKVCFFCEGFCYFTNKNIFVPLLISCWLNLLTVRYSQADLALLFSIIPNISAGVPQPTGCYFNTYFIQFIRSWPTNLLEHIGLWVWSSRSSRSSSKM